MATRINGVPIGPGMTFTIEPPDYRYGLGRVVIVVTEVLGVQHHDGQPWVEMRADEMVTGGAVSRLITVRLGAMKRGAR